MGSSESTGRSEEEPENNNPGEGSGGSGPSGTTIAVAAAGAAAIWGVSRMLSDNTNTDRGSNGSEEEVQPENNNPGEGSGGSGPSGTTIAVAAAGAAAIWGVSRMLSGNTNTDREENDDAMAMKASGLREANYLPNSYSSTFEGNHGSTLKQSTLSPPPLRRFKMNTDGATRSKQGPDRPNTGPSGYGGILRDDRGNWVRGFRGFIGESDCLTAEFHGILKGLELLDKLRLKGSILESDSTAAIDWIKRGYDSYGGHSTVIIGCGEIINECGRLIDKNRIIVNHIGKHANKCADRLANMAINSQETYVDIEDLPDNMEDIVNDDIQSFMENSSYHGSLKENYHYYQ